MIEVKGLAKKYGRVNALNNIEFEIKKGEIVGFLGPNGAGKSTTMNIITGFLPASAGTVRIDGFDIREHPREVRKRIGYLPEQPPLNPNMTVEEYLGFVGDLKQVERKTKKSRQSEVLERTGLTDVKGRLVRNLSKGYRQRVGIAQALVGTPEVLVLDEPTVGLDPQQILEIRRLVKDLGREHTILLSSHILPEVGAVCGRVIIINRGEILAVDTPEELSAGFGRYSNLLVTVSGLPDAIPELLSGLEGVRKVSFVREDRETEFTYCIETEREADIRGELPPAIVGAGFRLLELRSRDISLEDIFIKLVTEEKEVGRE